MKYKKIKLEGNKSVLVDESAEIKEGDVYIHTGVEHNLPKKRYYNLCQCHKPHRKIDGRNEYFVDGMFSKDCYKIIATINHSISLDVPMVIAEDKNNIEVRKIVAAQQYALDKCNDNLSGLTKVKLAWENGFETVEQYFKAAQQNVYSEEDLCDLVQQLKNYTKEGLTILGHDEREPQEFVNIFLESKQEYIELEMEEKILIKPYDVYNETVKFLKTARFDGQLMAYVK